MIATLTWGGRSEEAAAPLRPALAMCVMHCEVLSLPMSNTPQVGTKVP